ncbi:MAG: type II restriction endonuclease [Rickettsiales bacterium]|nr:type II restriction endonuclease [Rickettsiales bacterium]
MKDLIKLGSRTAKDGFRNERDVINRFNNWQADDLAKSWLIAMNYNLSDIEYVKAVKVKGSYKSDVQVQINVEVKLKKLLDIQNLQVKLVSNPRGFNQIDKRWVSKYSVLWTIPERVVKILKCFTGEIKPYIKNVKDKRRMFMDEFPVKDQQLVLNFVKENKSLIVSDILKGREKFAAEWMLVILKIGEENIKWSLKPMNFCLNLFGNGDVIITKRGSIKIGAITVQRKGGDGGRKSAQMLQFKINPCLIFDI